jgi:hypothetical protein
MATRKFVYADANGDFTESAGAYETADFIVTSAGGADAGKPIKLDASGKLDVTLIDQSDIDHGSISGLGDDDHTQYTLANGTRAFTGAQSMGGFKLTNVGAGTASTDGINKGQLDAAVSGLQDFRESVLDKDLLTPPGSPATGDRYLVGQPTDTATGAWIGFEGKIVEYNGSAWVEDVSGTPDEGTYVYVEDENQSYVFNNNTFASGLWVLFTTTIISAGNGIDLVGSTVSVDLASGGGLKIVSTEIAVEPSDFAGTGLQDDGSDNLEIDFADPATEMATSRAVKASDLSANGANQGAKILGADPSGILYSSSTTIQGVLEDLDDAIVASATPGVVYTVGAGGVTKGDLLYISAADTVLKKDITTSTYAVGLAFTTEAAAGLVKTVAENAVIVGALSGATAGTRYYWSGTALTTTMPATSGNYVWLVGVAKNATDLDVHVEFVKKNS